jgi:hypothetical protein
MEKRDIKERLQHLTAVNGHKEAFIRKYAQDDLRYLITNGFVEEKKVKVVRRDTKKRNVAQSVIRYQMTSKGFQIF